MDIISNLLPGAGECCLRCQSDVSDQPKSPCASCADVIYWAWWFATDPEGYDRVFRDVKRSQGRTAPAGGSLWSRVDRPAGCGPELARHVGSVALACVGKGPLMRGIAPEREAAARQAASDLFRPVLARDVPLKSAAALYRATKQALSSFLTPDAAQARALVEDRRSERLQADESTADAPPTAPEVSAASLPRARKTGPETERQRAVEVLARNGFRIVASSVASDGEVHLVLSVVD